MNFLIHNIAHSTPSWVDEGFKTYQHRLKPPFSLTIQTYAPAKNKNVITQKKQEAELLMSKIPTGSLIIALDSKGENLGSTENLYQQYQKWQHQYQSIVLLIGGAHGLDKTVLNQSHKIWSLSKLTLPHMLVRIILAEQIYRLFTLFNQHPYHK